MDLSSVSKETGKFEALQGRVDHGARDRLNDAGHVTQRSTLVVRLLSGMIAETTADFHSFDI